MRVTRGETQGDHLPWIEISAEQAEITVWRGWVYIIAGDVASGAQGDINAEEMQAIIAAWYELNPELNPLEGK